MVAKVALQAASWYNKPIKILFAPAMVEHPRAWIRSLEEHIMDTLHPHDSNGNPLKTCTACGNSFPATDEYFYRKRNGLNSQCKPCYNERVRLRKDKLKAQREELRDALSLPLGQKRCTACKNVFPASAEFFHLNKKAKDGFAERCKQCRVSYSKRYYQEHKDDRKVYNAQYHALHREENKDRCAKYNKEHSEEIRKKQKQYYEDNHEALMLQKAKYREENRERLKQYYQTPRGIIAKRAGAHNRRARKRNAEGTHTTEELYQQLKRQKNRCYYCKARLGKGRNNWNADHIVPLSKGGGNSIDNIVIACPKCNRDKYNRMPHEWRNGGRLC